MSKTQVEEKEDTVPVMVRVPVEVHKRLAQLAKKERRPVGPQVLKMIEDFLEQTTSQAAA